MACVLYSRSEVLYHVHVHVVDLVVHRSIVQAYAVPYTESYSFLSTAHGGGWGYSNSSVEAIRFSADTDIFLGGFGLYGGRGQYNAEIKVRHCPDR